jgi:hypothetical protein
MAAFSLRIRCAPVAIYRTAMSLARPSIAPAFALARRIAHFESGGFVPGAAGRLSLAMGREVIP